jgi:hypothetical protein
MFFDQYGNLLVAAGASTPVTVYDQVRAYIAAGQGFVYSTAQQQSPAGSVNLGLSVFNPSNSGKNVLIYSIKVFYTGYAMFFLAPTNTTDPALGNVALVVNSNLGNVRTSVASATYTNTSLTAPAASSILEGAQAAGNYTIADMLANNNAYLLPKGSANGLLLFFNSPSANTWIATIKGIEY